MSSKFDCQFACWQAYKLAGASARKTERQLALAGHPEAAVFRSIPESRTPDIEKAISCDLLGFSA
jgi:hypothetical protein